MLPKGKFICIFKRKFCVASFWFLAIVILFVFVFFSFTPALKAFVSTKFSISTSPLKISQVFIFPHSVFGRSGCQLSNSTVIFLPDVSDVWRWPNPVKTLNVPFLLRNLQWNQRMNSSWTMYITKGKIFNFFILNGAVGISMGIKRIQKLNIMQK